MSQDLLFNFFQRLEGDFLSFIYQADFNPSLNQKILELGNLGPETTSKEIEDNLAVVVDECLQNVIHHAGKPEILNSTNDRPSMFMLRRLGSDCFIGSSNLVERERTDQLEAKLSSLNQLSKSELEQLYNSVGRTKGTPNGSGFGLLEMARRTGHKFSYVFDFVNFYYSLFHFQVKVNLNPRTRSRKAFSVDEMSGLYDTMRRWNIMAVYKGTFDQTSILPLLHMLERNLKEQEVDRSVQKRLIYILIELLQNVNRHGASRDHGPDGILLVARDGKNFVVKVGNVLEGKAVEPLKKYLDEIVELDPERLAELYKKNLTVQPKSYSNTGLGLIDICRYSQAIPDYRFLPLSKDTSFFSFSTSVQ